MESLGLDRGQGFWIKYLTSCNQRIADQMEEILNAEDKLPEWMTSSKTVLCVKDPTKGNRADNFRPIACLPSMGKLITGIIAEVYTGFWRANEQEGCRRKSRGTKDQLIIGKMVLKDCRRRNTNLAMTWIDYRKA